MTTTKTFLPVIALLFVTYTVTAQPQKWKNKKYFTVMSYNVENLFDTLDTESKNDSDFLPGSEKEWGTKRYFNKIDKLAQVIASVNKNEMPEIIGLVEVETRTAVTDLAAAASIKKAGYKVVHYDGPDPRGIDCALLYRPDAFTVINSYPVQVAFAFAGNARTRDILYVSGKTKTDTLHLFVNHWTSRRGGDETEDKRNHIARVLKQSVDSVLLINPNANIIIMGDMNDEPNNTSLTNILGAHLPDSSNCLVNIMYQSYLDGKGTYYYRGQYNMLDNIIINKKTLNKNKGFRPYATQGFIHMPEFLCYIQKNGDKTPSKTYGGKNYFGGYSDHFAVYAVFYQK